MMQCISELVRDISGRVKESKRTRQAVVIRTPFRLYSHEGSSTIDHPLLLYRLSYRGSDRRRIVYPNRLLEDRSVRSFPGLNSVQSISTLQATRVAKASSPPDVNRMSNVRSSIEADSQGNLTHLNDSVQEFSLIDNIHCFTLVQETRIDYSRRSFPFDHITFQFLERSRDVTHSFTHIRPDS